MTEEQLKNLNSFSHPSNWEAYNDYVLSDKFKEEYEKLKEKYYPDADPSTYFNDVVMFDHEGNVIKYPEYMRLYPESLNLRESSSSKVISEGK